MLADVLRPPPASNKMRKEHHVLGDYRRGKWLVIFQTMPSDVNFGASVQVSLIGEPEDILSTLDLGLRISCSFFISPKQRLPEHLAMLEYSGHAGSVDYHHQIATSYCSIDVWTDSGCHEEKAKFGGDIRILGLTHHIDEQLVIELINFVSRLFQQHPGHKNDLSTHYLTNIYI